LFWFWMWVQGCDTHCTQSATAVLPGDVQDAVAEEWPLVAVVNERTLVALCEPASQATVYEDRLSSTRGGCGEGGPVSVELHRLVLPDGSECPPYGGVADDQVDPEVLASGEGTFGGDVVLGLPAS
jgi:hypothetical protein